MKEYFKKVKERLNKKKDNKKKGFTLIELLAVIVILAIVLVVTIPSVLNSMKSAKEKQFENAIKIVEDYMTTQYELCKSGLRELNNNYDSSLFVSNCEINPEKGSDDILKASDTSKDVIAHIYDYRIENEKFKIGFASPGNSVKENSNKLLINYITSLYNTAKKEEAVTSNNIKYHYANLYENRGGLMNDRRGGTIGIDDGNIRYYGANPNNYIYFNCSDYTNQSNSTCEKWRIIGVIDGKIKIIRNESIGNYSWDTSVSGINNGYGINQWGESTYTTGEVYDGAYLMQHLNGDYYNNLNGNTKDLIANATWYTGAIDKTSANTTKVYNLERGLIPAEPSSCPSSICNDTIIRTATWTGKVGLMYVSDYGYAADLNKCTALNSYNSTTNNYECRSNDWLYKGINEWTLGRYKDTYNDFLINLEGNVVFSNSSSSYAVRPAYYLNSSSIIAAGDGSQNSPYQLSLRY